ncbi:MAG: epoxyqueuosine reductase QueH [Alphaproteobacteria bacterium]|nr:epoxyqueuosine reductase QueH [Alphaproteobacteria bacterium]
MTDHIKLSLPDGANEVLLHVCCAPCSGEVIEAMQAAEVNFTIFFYNPNIHPRAEYDMRKDESLRFARRKNIPFVDADYDPDTWFARIKGLEDEPERGRRCAKCFDMRLERAALYAHENKFPLFATSLGISRWKNMEQVNECGTTAAARYENLKFWDYNWRKHGGANRMVEIAKRENFYQQEYCGCVYSLRDANKCRKESDREIICIGNKFYGENK